MACWPVRRADSEPALVFRSTPAYPDIAQSRPPPFFSCTATVPSGSPAMVLSVAVIFSSSVRHLPTLPLSLEPAPAVVPWPSEPLPVESFPPPCVPPVVVDELLSAADEPDGVAAVPVALADEVLCPASEFAS